MRAALCSGVAPILQSQAISVHVSAPDYRTYRVYLDFAVWISFTHSLTVEARLR